MRSLRYSMLLLALLAANVAAARHLYTVLLPQRGRISCIWLDLRESPGPTLAKLARAAAGR
jgi:hypothetical protein